MKLKEPVIIVNLKTYQTGTGSNAVKMAKLAGQLAKSSIIVASQATDIKACSEHAITFAQHIDAAEQGKATGYITAEAVKSAGAKGTLINHAEHKIGIELIKKTVERATQNKLVTVACAANVEEAKQIAKECNPDYIALEIPELISGNISISQADPGAITRTISEVSKIREIPIICGAGISGREDVRKALDLGTKGVLVANFVVNAADKKKALSELVAGLKEQ